MDLRGMKWGRTRLLMESPHLHGLLLMLRIFCDGDLSRICDGMMRLDDRSLGERRNLFKRK